jgi:hypothetical protein
MCIFGGLIAVILLGLGEFFIRQGGLLTVLIDLGISLREIYCIISAFGFHQRCLFISSVLAQLSSKYYSSIV